jgi:3-deoxy-D-manno-octulosonic-acid transferase
VFVSLYQLTIRTYVALMGLVAKFHPKAKLWVEGRKGLLDRLRREIPEAVSGRPVAWFHAASLGEFEQGRPVMEQFKTDYPDYFILLTFFSPSGYEVRKNYSGADYICYLPADTPGNAKSFVDILKPQIAFFIKYEFWYNYLVALKNSDATIVSFSTIFRKNQLFFKSYGGFYRNLLAYFDAILVQNEESVKLLEGIGLNNVIFAGDTRFDRVCQIAEAAPERTEIAAFAQSHFCMVVGSAWAADREVLVPIFNSLEGKLKLIVAPHEIKEEELQAWEKGVDGKCLRYSSYKRNHFSADDLDGVGCLIIDNVGMLSSLYRYGKLAYVGGAFGDGLHNVLEAAAFGAPVFFGNRNYTKFQEAVDLISLSGATAVDSSGTLQREVDNLMENSSVLKDRGMIARNYVFSHRGATAVVMEAVRKFIQ